MPKHRLLRYIMGAVCQKTTPPAAVVKLEPGANDIEGEEEIRFRTDTEEGFICSKIYFYYLLKGTFDCRLILRWQATRVWSPLLEFSASHFLIRSRAMYAHAPFRTQRRKASERRWSRPSAPSRLLRIIKKYQKTLKTKTTMFSLIKGRAFSVFPNQTTRGLLMTGILG